MTSTLVAGCRRQWFLLAIIGALLTGALGHGLLGEVADRVPRGWLVAAIMFCMSATIDLSASVRQRGALLAVVIGVLVNAAVAPPLAWLFALALPAGFGVGLITAALVPSTLASGAVWTRRGGGNDAVALAITVATNAGCFLIAPAWVWLLLGAESDVAGSKLVVRLLAIAVTPILTGQLLRRPPAVRRWLTSHKASISLAAQLGLLVMVLVGAVRCGKLLGAGGEAFPWLAALGLLVAAALLHVLLFTMAWLASRASGLAAAESLAAAIGGSQKTLAVGLDLAIGLTAGLAPAAAAVAILPMIVYHAAQLVIDAVLVETRPFRAGSRP